MYASPLRTLVFDLNDFDETLPGPFEYDVKRLAASFTIAARNNGFAKADARAATLATVAAYRNAMAEFAEMGTMDIWYAHLTEDDVLRAAGAAATGKGGGKGGGKGKGANAKGTKDTETRQLTAARDTMRKAHTRDSLHALSKLGEVVDGRYRIVNQAPIVIPSRDLQATYGMSGDDVEELLSKQLRAYRATLQHDRRHLLEQFQVVDIARKVVGVGSVGARAFIVLLQGRDERDPLFLQVKEATSSVLEDHLPGSGYPQHGARVVHGQRMMQATSDIYLGWTKGLDVNRHYYWRQLRDMKGSAEPESMVPAGLAVYGYLCGWTLARAHARSGDPIAIAAYLGASEKFDRSITDFAERYADRNEQDYQAFAEAIRSGRLEAHEGV